MLRQATTGDIAGIQHVRRSVRENRLVSTVISDEDVREAIEESGRGWVVEADDGVVGFAIGNAASGNIWALFVHPEVAECHASCRSARRTLTERPRDAISPHC